MPTRLPTSRFRAAALIAVLWVGMLVSLILLGVRLTSRVNLALAHSELASVQAHWLARAGIEQAMAALEDDTRLSDSSLDIWYEYPDQFEEVAFGSGEFSLFAPTDERDPAGTPRHGLVDLAGRFDINHADEKQLEAFEFLDSVQAASLLDWRDKDEEIRPGGCEREYYLRQDFPYEIRNGPFQTIHELRLVRGIDDQAFFAEDPDLDGILDANEDDGPITAPIDDGDGLLQRGLGGLVTVHNYELNQDGYGDKRHDVNEIDEQTLKVEFNFSSSLARGFVEHRKNKKFERLVDLLEVRPASGDPRADADDPEGAVEEISVQWLGRQMDQLTVSDEQRLFGKLNVNSASHEVLMTLPQMTKELAQAIVKFRNSSKGPFHDQGDLLSVPGMTEDAFKEIAERVTPRSYVFAVTSVGTARSGVRRRITAVIDRGAEPFAILYWDEGE